MKIQCACGAKYEFDAKPEMLQNPVRFVCPACGLDSSDFVNELIRREFAEASPSASAPPPEVPKLRIARPETQAPQPMEATTESVATVELCPKHLREPAIEHCVVCGRPICRKCMELFGYVCSPLCRAKAEAQNIEVPVYAGKKTLTEAQYWRKAGIVGGIVGTLVALALAFWFWYAWIGSVPHTVFSVHFDDVAYTGESALCGTDQIVFLHGGTLARYDIKSGKEIWSKVLVTPRQIADVVAAENRLKSQDRFARRIPQNELEEMATRQLEGRLQLQVSGRHVWIATAQELTHYNWNTGRVLQKIPLPGGAGQLVARNGEFLMTGVLANGETAIIHIDPATGKWRVEEFGQQGQMLAGTTHAANSPNEATAGLPLTPGADQGQPMNPATVGQQAQSLGLAGRIALPALIANSSEQERIQAELDDGNHSPPPASSAPQKSTQNTFADFTVIPGQSGYVEMAVRLLKSHVVTREAMRPSSGKSGLTGDLSTANETAAANEMLNEMQRNRGGGTVQEDESLYQVSLRRPEASGPADWTGEVVGFPALYPLKTVNVLAAGKTLIVLDKANKKLWQATLTYNVPDAGRGEDGQRSEFGEGPCVEHGNTLYVFDQAVLTAYDLRTGDARWRVPTVGVVGLFFDHHGMLYVNTTTANPDSVRYSRQIDITQRIQANLLKIDPRNGKILWNGKPGGFISYLAGDFIYTVETYIPTDDEIKMADTAGITPNPPHIKIRRLNPANGEVMWEYYEADKGAPLDVQFHNNSIQIVFSKEVDVLKYLAL